MAPRLTITAKIPSIRNCTFNSTLSTALGCKQIPACMNEATCSRFRSKKFIFAAGTQKPQSNKPNQQNNLFEKFTTMIREYTFAW